NARMRRGDSASLQQPGIGSSASKRAGALEHIAKSTGQSQEEDLYPSVSGNKMPRRAAGADGASVCR
ncbi:hypothetical protein, partial [Methylobacterium radiotolerans]|uniref:hypothetical protein n=1 Tax=Methylobacterium radiotolerans TaxID=31998 RepID=UPI001AED25DA